MESIVCRKCKILKPNTAYIKSNKYKGGYYYDCKECYAIRRKELNNIKKTIQKNITTIQDENNIIITTTNTKECSICKINKVIDQSYSKTKNGYSSKCIDCFAKFREHIRKTTILVKVCTLCKKEKNTTEFYRHKKAKDGYKERCIDCSKITQFSTEENKKRDARYLHEQIKQCSSCKEEKPFADFKRKQHISR